MKVEWRLWWKRSGHDPEREAALYLSGDLRPRARLGFEAHLLSCEECWGEVRLGRSGRLVAETAREIAPAPLREDIRAAVALSTGPRPGRRVPFLVPSIAVVLAGALLGGLLLTRGGHQPESIAAALVSFRSNRVPVGTPLRPAPDLAGAGLSLERSGRASMGGLEVDVFAYRTENGSRVFLLLSDRPFPQAQGASERTGPAQGWSAVDEGVILRCAEHPESFLLLGLDAGALQQAQDALEGQLDQE